MSSSSVHLLTRLQGTSLGSFQSRLKKSGTCTIAEYCRWMTHRLQGGRGQLQEQSCSRYRIASGKLFSSRLWRVGTSKAVLISVDPRTDWMRKVHNASSIHAAVWTWRRALVRSPLPGSSLHPFNHWFFLYGLSRNYLFSSLHPFNH